MRISGREAARSLSVVTIIIALPALLAWWVKGDLEIAWLLAMPIVVLGSALGGALAGFVRAGVTGATVGGAAAGGIGVLALIAALNTPHGRALTPSTAHVAALERVAADTVALRRALEAATGSAYGFIAERGELHVREGRRSKRGFSFRSDVREPAFEVSATFAVGPAAPVLFDAVRDGSSWRLHARALPRADDVRVSAAALRQLFPDVPQVEGAPHGPFEPGGLMLVRASRSERDWELRLLRVAGPGAALAETARLDAAAIRARLHDEARRRSLDPADDVVAWFRPGEGGAVLLSAEPAFRFFVTLQHARYHQAQFLAVIGGDSIGFVQERVLTRPGVR